MEFSQVLFSRRSCRRYTGEPVSDEALNTVLAAANAAPVGMGAYQTIHLTVIRSRDFLDVLSKAAGAFMKREDDPLYGTPMIILVSAKPGVPPTIEFQNTGAIIENMMLQATDLGLGSVYLMGAVAALKTRPELIGQLKLPEGFVPIAAMALGRSAEAAPRRTPEQKIATDYLD